MFSFIVTTVMTMVTRSDRRRLSKRVRRIRNRAMPRVELRDRIQRTALRLFREHGFDSTSVDQIVAAADVAKGTFFNFYKTKQAVLADYYCELDSFMSDRLQELDPTRPAESLDHLFRSMEHRLRDEGDLACVLFREIMQNPSLGAADFDSGLDDCKQYERFFDSCRTCGTVGESVAPRLAAEIVQDLWASTVQRWFHAGRSFPFADVLTQKIKVLFTGLKPGQSSVRGTGSANS